MKTLLLARHGESEYSARALVNGDPGVRCPLTDAGRAQARALGEALRGERLDLCAVTEFERVRETADLALMGRDVPRLVVPELNDPLVGPFEGRALDEYRQWAWGRGPTEAPEGAEHRAALAARYAIGLHRLLERAEESVLLVAHSLPIRYALEGAGGRHPEARAEAVAYATPFRLERADVERAAAVLEAWASAPAFSVTMG
ncbi:MAG TPA: histidine phosphatase family protein [Gaiellaceae bacterium]|nr:histidine phosphatase family protein [Gaiellaceae bacterium]